MNSVNQVNLDAVSKDDILATFRSSLVSSRHKRIATRPKTRPKDCGVVYNSTVDPSISLELFDNMTLELNSIKYKLIPLSESSRVGGDQRLADAEDIEKYFYVMPNGGLLPRGEITGRRLEPCGIRGSVLYKIRLDLGLSQTALASILHITQATVSRKEAGVTLFSYSDLDLLERELPGFDITKYIDVNEDIDIELMSIRDIWTDSDGIELQFEEDYDVQIDE